MLTRRHLGLALGAAPFLPRPARAQGFPDRPIRMVVPFQPGGGIDAIARLAAAPLGTTLGQPVVVENRPGAAGTIAAEYVGRSAPDGYTLLYGSISSFVLARYSQPRLSYDPLHSFAPVGTISEAPFVLLASRSVPAINLAELLALAKTRPNGLVYASPGNGTVPHLLCAQLAKSAGVPMLHVPYQGGSAQVSDLISGRVDVMFDTLAGAMAMLQGDKVRALTVTGPERPAVLPGVQTLAEAGFPALTYVQWTMLLGPAGLPAPVRDRLSEALSATLSQEEVRQSFARLGLNAHPNPPAALQELLEREDGAWKETASRVAAGEG
jgi:tripartite-type tricarboxylate transporter receptor subunit TctC